MIKSKLAKNATNQLLTNHNVQEQAILIYLKTRKIDFFVSYIGEKLRHFLCKFNPNSCLINPKVSDNPKLGLLYENLNEVR